MGSTWLLSFDFGVFLATMSLKKYFTTITKEVSSQIEDGSSNCSENEGEVAKLKITLVTAVKLMKMVQVLQRRLMLKFLLKNLTRRT